MFGPLGFQEVLFILVLALLIFGPKRLPELGRTIGKGMAQFRKASNDLKRSIETEIALEERQNPPHRPSAFIPSGRGPVSPPPPSVTFGRPAATEKTLAPDPEPAGVAAPPSAPADDPVQPS